MSIEPSLHSGARHIVRQSLGMEPNQQLVIFVDETTIQPGVIIAEAAESAGVPYTALLVPVAIQRRIPMQTDLSLLAQGVAREARAILTCVNASPECLPFRQRILETQWTARTRIGHMPGASPEVLKLADVDFDQLIADCWCMEIAMARGRNLELTSYASSGLAHSLRVDIGGWERLPVASDGVISDGAWGNVPSGETYIAPVEGSAEGSVVINGSIPGLVIAPDAEMVLFFERGHLVRLEPPDGPAARWLQKTQVAKAKAAGDLNWSNLAEIGVGINPAVEHLTGNMLLDEKAAGTAHIALGANTFMGGHVHATIHCDMITRAPSIRIDGKRVVDRGVLCFRESEWHDRHSDISLQDSPAQSAVDAARSGIQAKVFSDGRLQRILRPEPGRISACFVGDSETAQLAHTLYTTLSDEGDWSPVETLATQVNLDRQLVRRLLHVMWSYDLVKVR